MQNENPRGKSYKGSIILCGILASALMLVSFVMALSNFSAPAEISESSYESIEDQTSEVSEYESIVINEPDEYKYYNNLQFERQPYSNSLVANGSLAVINQTTTKFPIIDESNIVNIGTAKTPGVYGLANMSLVMYEEAISNIDKFVVSFYDQVPSNGLIINKGYVASSSVSSSETAVDLVTGYSVQFSIYNSSYKFSDNEFAYLREQAYKYGVIQRYPNGKDNYTGHSNDNTIYRYVGFPHSMYMNHYMLSLEEYLDRIRTYKVIEYESELETDTVYVVYYVPLEESTGTTYVDVPVGDNVSYTVSGDGDRGFVVTVKIQQ